MTVPDSVWELPTDFDWDPQAVHDYVEKHYPTTDEEYDDVADAIGTLWNLASGLFWYCVDWHGGMGSDEYRLSCQSSYKPGASECSPSGDNVNEENEGDAYAYRMLEQHNQEVTT